MKKLKEFDNKIKDFVGSILIIGDLGEKVSELIENNTNITETYWLNSVASLNDEDDEASIDVASDFNFAYLHKHLKKGIDNTICNYNEIKKVIPKFIRESLRITKKNIYIYFDKEIEYELVLKKYKRYNLKCEIEEYKEFNLLIVEANDIIVNTFKENYYYIIDNLEKIYNNISDNI